MDFFATIPQQIPWAPPWAISLPMFLVAIVAAVLVHRLVFKLATRFVAHKDLFWRSLVERSKRPTRFALEVVAMGIVAPAAPLTTGQSEVIRQVLLLSFIALTAWTAHTALHVWTTVYLRRFKLDSEDNLQARKHATQTHILKRVAATLITTIAIAAALMTFDNVRQYGVSLLASAGAAGLIAGFALQPVLKNIFAGIQLAVTQPIRIDDALLVEGEWGNVEEITSTYVVVRLWDWRRMILPLSYFIEHPFQNWTRDDSALIGTVMLYLDYGAPIAEIRKKVDEIARASPLWDRRVVNVQVTDFRQTTMEVRVLASASSASRTFDLRCHIREKLIIFLQETYPASLPRQRTDVSTPAFERLRKVANG